MKRLLAVLGVVVLAGCRSGSDGTDTTARSPKAELAADTADEPATKRGDDGMAADPEPTCLARWAIDHEDSVLREHRTHAKVDDFHERYRAEAITEQHAPVEAVARFQIDHRPLVWLTPDKSDVVVDGERLSELTVVDAALGLDAPRTLGALKLPLADAATAGLDGRGLLEALIRAGAIRTYMHIGASLCLVRESSDRGGYQARVEGTHEYYTNEQNIDDVAFTFEVTADGTLTVGP